MIRFQYLEPRTLEEAVAMLERYNGRANILAGGTDLLVEIREHIRRPEYVLNIKKIPGLDILSYDPETGLRIGSLTTARAVETFPAVAEKYAGLHRATLELGSIQVRNRATVAGNICRASPSADTLPPLIADGASVRLFGPEGERMVRLEKFFMGPGKTVLKKGEILLEITVPAPPPRTGKVYFKLGRRKAMELATVGVAVTLSLEGSTCKDIKIALAAVAPTPIRAREAEKLLAGANLDEALMERAAAAAQREARPISDVRSSAEYRRHMVKVLTCRALVQALERAESEGREK